MFDTTCQICRVDLSLNETNHFGWYCVIKHTIGGVMKIMPSAYSHMHSGRALKRLHRAVICQQVMRHDLHKMYKAMLHLERYMDRLKGI